jgi:FAD:protein FMN transferase
MYRTGRVNKLRNILMGITITAALVVLEPVVASCAGQREPQRQTETRVLLGTVVSVTTYGDVAHSVFDEVFDRVAEIESKMSVSREDYDSTELLAVNDAAGLEPVAVSPDTYYVVEQALSYSYLTDGAFNVAIEPLVRLWGIGTNHAAVPSAEQLETALAEIDYGRVVMEPTNHTVYLPEAGMGLDVGGIAKGYAADEVARILIEHGVEHALLDFGGNVVVIGTKVDGSDWRIGIQNPDPDASRGTFIGVLPATDLAIVTSGPYERYFIEDGVRYHHILDSTTGYPVWNGLQSVTIVNEVSIRADALSTAVFSMGLVDGMSFVENHDGVEAIFIDEDDIVYVSSGLSSLFVLTDDNYRLAE